MVLAVVAPVLAGVSLPFNAAPRQRRRGEQNSITDNSIRGSSQSALNRDSCNLAATRRNPRRVHAVVINRESVRYQQRMQMFAHAKNPRAQKAMLAKKIPAASRETTELSSDVDGCAVKALRRERVRTLM